MHTCIASSFHLTWGCEVHDNPSSFTSSNESVSPDHLLASPFASDFDKGVQGVISTTSVPSGHTHDVSPTPKRSATRTPLLDSTIDHRLAMGKIATIAPVPGRMYGLGKARSAGEGSFVARKGGLYQGSRRTSGATRERWRFEPRPNNCCYLRIKLSRTTLHMRRDSASLPPLTLWRSCRDIVIQMWSGG